MDKFTPRLSLNLERTFGPNLAHSLDSLRSTKSCFHVVLSGNRRKVLFATVDDRRALNAIAFEVLQRFDATLHAYCLMPNHFHLVLWPRKDGDLGRWMQWLLTSHVRRYHKHYHSSGHVWQGRFKAFPIPQDEHFLTVLRYAERNALRAGLLEGSPA